MVEATEGMAEAIMGDSVMAMAFLGDLDMIGGVILTGGTTLTILTTIPTMILIIIPTILIMGFTGNRRRLRRGWFRRQNRDNNNLLFGASARTQRVTTLTSKIAAGVG